MHQWTVLHMVSVNSGNVEISWGGWGKLSKQRVRSSNGYLRLLDHACLHVTIVGIVPLYLSNHAYGFCVIHIQ